MLGERIVQKRKMGSGPLPGRRMSLLSLFLELPWRQTPRPFSRLQKKNYLEDFEPIFHSIRPLLRRGGENRGYRKEFELNERENRHPEGFPSSHGWDRNGCYTWV